MGIAEKIAHAKKQLVMVNGAAAVVGIERGKSSGFPLSCLHPHFNIFHLFLIGDFLRAGIIAGGEAAKQYKSLQAEKYNERNSHFIPEKATEWQILTHNSRI